MSTPLVIDADAHTDDAVAILLALAHPALDLRGVTAATADEAHALAALVGPAPVPIETGPGRLAELVRAAPAPVTLVTTGPLTHLAAALAADRSLPRAVARLVVVGGAHRAAGVTAHAERNVWTDPAAAATVLAAPFRDTWLVTADATASAALTDADLARLRASGAGAAADLCAERLDRGALVHDPLAVAAVVDPTLLVTLRAAVRVECTDPTTYGATRFAAEVDERRGRTTVAVGADRQRYVDLLCTTLGKQH